MTQNELIDKLTEQTKSVLNGTESLLLMDGDLLSKRPSEKSWNALECIEHLNRYARFYHVEIAKIIENQPKVAENIPFKTGRLGNHFSKSMEPKEKLNTMKTFKSMNPLLTNVKTEALEEFRDHQKTLLKLLQECRKVNLSKVKTSITISSLIKLRLGDTLRVVINHNLRHMIQAQKATQS